MIINKLKLTGFKKYNDKEFIFNNGLNIIYGNNEAGKSTLFQGILTTLLGCGPNNKGLLKREECVSWIQNEVCIGEMQFTVNSEVYTIKRNLIESRVKLFKQEGKENVLISESLKNVNAKIFEFLSVDDSRVITKSLFIHQGDMAGVSDNLTLNEVKKNLEKSITGTKVKTPEEVLNNLNNLRKKIKKRNNEKPGLLDTLPLQLETLREDYTQLVQNSSRHTGNLEKIKLLNKQIEDKKKEFETLKLFGNNITQTIAVKKEKEKVSEGINIILKKVNLIKELTEKSNNQSIQEYIRELDSFNRSYMEYKVICDQAKGLKTSLMNTRSLDDNQKIDFKNNFIKKIKVSLWSSLVIMFFTIILNFQYKNASYLLLIVLGIFFYLVSVYYAHLRACKKNTEIPQLQSQLNSLEIKKKFFVNKYKFNEDTKLVIKEMQDKIDVYNQNKAKLNALQEEYSLEQLMDMQNAKTIKLNQLELQLKDKKQFMESKLEDQFAIDAKIEFLEKEIKTLSKDKYFLEGQSEASKKYSIDQNALLGEIKYLENYIETLKTKYEAILIAIEVIEESIGSFKSNTLVDLEKNMSEYFQDWTQNRYKGVLIANNWPQIEVTTKDSENISNIEQLSQGTIEQLYLALRMSIVKHLSLNKQLPIFLDDPFVNFDKGRLSETLKCIKNISDNHQTFYFTCHEFVVSMLEDEHNIKEKTLL